MHPLQTNLSELSDTEVDNKIKDLTNKYFTVLQVSPTAGTQVLMLLEGYKAEKESREFARRNSKENLGEEFNDLIRVG